MQERHLHCHLAPIITSSRCDTLKGDYTEQAIRERIAGTRVVEPRPRPTSQRQTLRKVGMLIDIQAAIQSGKGSDYERLARLFNLKQLSQAVNHLKKHGDLNYSALEEKVATITARFNDLSGRIKELEARLNDNAAMQKHIINYSKNRAVYVEYLKAGYSKKFRSVHEADILIHQTAKKAFDEMGYGKDKKIPTVAALRAAIYRSSSRKEKSLCWLQAA